jgi:hypothetical protein
MLVAMTGYTLPRRLLGLDAPQPTAREARLATSTESVIVLIAGLSFVAGLIHVGASIAHISVLPVYATAFATVAGLQIGWAAWLSRRPTRRALVTGLVANVAIVALWLTSLTVSVPTGAGQPLAHPHALYLCFLSVIQSSGGGINALVASVAILPELVIALAVLAVLGEQSSALARRTIPRLAPLLLAAMFLSVLYGVGGQ